MSRFDRTVPPARRATDRYLSVGFTGVALLGMIVVVRAAWRGDWVAAVTFGGPTLLVGYAAVGLVALVVRHRRARRAGLRRHRNHG